MLPNEKQLTMINLLFKTFSNFVLAKAAARLSYNTFLKNKNPTTIRHAITKTGQVITI